MLKINKTNKITQITFRIDPLFQLSTTQMTPVSVLNQTQPQCLLLLFHTFSDQITSVLTISNKLQPAAISESQQQQQQKAPNQLHQ
ncbi:hypothetical protein H5410_021099 [Solanum commersonii]|uniref:Uncharacterized protein n=1 Tax=Solanum commersonii TaxID=4109 RepID=A0A9J5ZB02_SOLCO|nr:hypothetical protein H5410_021099 [Solanum commersonii]